MVKTILSVVLGLAAVGSLAFAVTEAPRARAAVRPTIEPLALRPFPSSSPSQPTPQPKTTAAASASAAPPAPTPTATGVAKTTGPVVAAPAAVADAGVKAAPPVVAAKVEPAPRPPPVGDGVLHLRASDTADVYLDGKKIGSSPLNNVRARSGQHKLRFDCYDAAGNAVAGQVKLITVVADEEQEVEYPCPESQ